MMTSPPYQHRPHRYTATFRVLTCSIGILVMCSLVRNYYLGTNFFKPALMETALLEDSTKPHAVSPSEDMQPSKELAPAPTCNDTELELLKRNRFLRGGAAILSFESRCPRSTWLDDMLRLDYEDSKHSRLSVTVGCNKAIDAIGTARSLSHNPVFDKPVWGKTMENFTKQTMSAVCFPKQKWRKAGYAFDPKQLELSNTMTMVPLEFHCIEPIPSTFQGIQRSIKYLGLHQHGFQAHQYVMSNSSGSVPFPVGEAGIEHLSANMCSQADVTCHDVPMLTLDDFSTQHIRGKNQKVDILSIDTEGFDWRVLRGARKVLERTRYLDFEYHSVWGDDMLKDAVDYLEDLNFVCYFAGKGRLFKVTHGCWLNKLHEIHEWSNVACVHRSEHDWLAIMEGYFQKTLAFG